MVLIIGIKAFWYTNVIMYYVCNLACLKLFNGYTYCGSSASYGIVYFLIVRKHWNWKKQNVTLVYRMSLLWKKLVYYKTLSDSNWRENNYYHSFLLFNKICVWGGEGTKFVLNNKYDQLLSFLRYNCYLRVNCTVLFKLFTWYLSILF